jgi:GNAT superfamily N-acetyltransferase
MEWRRDSYTIDTDRARPDMDTIVGWLRETYWARHRPPTEIRRSWENAALIFVLYDGEHPIGCARVVSDLVSVAYVADVLILPDYRGRGLGRWMIETIISHSELATVKWLLHTRDAHALYQQVGFGEPGPRLMERGPVRAAATPPG